MLRKQREDRKKKETDKETVKIQKRQERWKEKERKSWRPPRKGVFRGAKVLMGAP